MFSYLCVSKNTSTLANNSARTYRLHVARELSLGLTENTPSWIVEAIVKQLEYDETLFETKDDCAESDRNLKNLHSHDIRRYRSGVKHCCFECQHSMFSCELALGMIVFRDQTLPPSRIHLYVNPAKQRRRFRGEIDCCPDRCDRIVPIGRRKRIGMDADNRCLFCRLMRLECRCNCRRRHQYPLNQPRCRKTRKTRTTTKRNEFESESLYDNFVKRFDTFQGCTAKRISRYHDRLSRILCMAHFAYDSRIFSVRCTSCLFSPSRYDMTLLFPRSSRNKILFTVSDLYWLLHCSNDDPTDAQFREFCPDENEVDGYGLIFVPISTGVEKNNETATIATTTTAAAAAAANETSLFGVPYKDVEKKKATTDATDHSRFSGNLIENGNLDEDSRTVKLREEEIVAGLIQLTEWHEIMTPTCPTVRHARNLIDCLSGARVDIPIRNKDGVGKSKTVKNIASYLVARQYKI